MDDQANSPSQSRRMANDLQGDAVCGEVCAAEGGEGGEFWEDGGDVSELVGVLGEEGGGGWGGEEVFFEGD